MSIVYLNGKFIPLKQAKVSVLDRGFLFCDGIYEVITIYNGKLFRLKEHLKRLKQSLKAIQLSIHMNQKEWESIFNTLLIKNKIGKKNKSLYLQITRGKQNSREYGIPAECLKPTVFVMLKSLKQPNYQKIEKGFKLITHEDLRWKLPSIKSISLLPNILLSHKAKAKHAEETILIRNGYILEGTNSNIFIVKNNKIITPPVSLEMLSGITRELVLEIAKKYRIPLHEKKFTLKELYNADEVWITSSSRDIMPIGQVDQHRIGDGKPGPLWKKMSDYFQTYKSSL